MTPDAVALLVVALFKSTTTLPANEAHQRLAGMPEEKRREAMTLHMRRSNESCNVSRTVFQAFDNRGTAYWNVACTNGDAYLVGIRNDAPASVLNCNGVKTVAGVECFRKF